jgi:hypothetical protein
MHISPSTQRTDKKQHVKPRRGFVFFCFALSSCVTYEASLQSGRTLKPGTSSHGLALHYLLDHQEDVLKQRLRGEEAVNYATATHSTGLSYHYRRGLRSGLDAGLALSPQISSIGMSWNLINRPRFALALSPKLLMPMYSVDVLSSYWGGVLVPASFDLLEDASVLLTPAWYRRPMGSDRHSVVALHTGLLLGRERGIIFEWSFYEELYSQEHRESKEQIKIGVLSGLGNFSRPAYNREVGILRSIRPSFGVELPGLLRCGAVLALEAGVWAPDQLWLAFSLPEVREDRAHRRSRYLGLRRNVLLGENLRLGLGLAYRELLADVGTREGYQLVRVGVPVMGAGLEWGYRRVNFRLFETLFPLHFWARSRVEKDEDGEVAPEVEELGRHYTRQISLLLVQGEVAL